MQTGRNDPCPCGSGRKYKKCCFAAEQAVPLEVARANSLKAADRVLMERLMSFASRRFGDAWIDFAITAYSGSPKERIGEYEYQLLIPWAVYHLPVGDRGIPVAQYFVEENARRLSGQERDLIDAQLQTWLSIWEIRDVMPGVGMSVVDQLTKEERFVHEVAGSADANPRDSVLLLVTTVGGVSFATGTHPQPLGPRDAEYVVREARGMCRVRTRPVRIDVLLDVVVQIELIHLWREIFAEAAVRPHPQLTNTDGDEMVATTDHFDILTSDHSILVDRLAKLPGATEPEPGERPGNETVIVMTKAGNASMKSWDNTVIGTIIVGENRLKVETNSARRADALRDLLASEAGDLLRYRLRSDVSQEEMFRSALEEPSGNKRRGAPDPEQTAMMRELREQYMTAWLDEEIPALGGLTPREAAMSAKSRKALDLLLREFEGHEARVPQDERIDIDRLRAELDMPG